jgi:ferredoxin
LRDQYDAVLVACGNKAKEHAAAWGLNTAMRGIQADLDTFATGAPGVFAAGSAVRGKCLVVRSVADGKEAAASIDQYLRAEPVRGPAEAFSTRIGKMEPQELSILLATASAEPLCSPQAGLDTGYAPDEARRQAARCLHCDCRGLHTCKLRHYAATYGARPRRYQTVRRAFQQDTRHAEVLYEPGKCIDCGLCVQITAAAREPLGLTYIGRGFNVRIGPPLDRPLQEALQKVAAACVAACPTAALAWKKCSTSRGR